VQGVYPGVEVHANIIAGLLDGSFMRQPEWAQGVEFLVLLVVGVLLGLLLPNLSALWMSVSTLLVTALVVGGNFYVWQKLDFILPVATTMALISGLFLFHMIYGFFSETKSRMALKKSFGLYVPPEIVDEMNLQEEEVSLNSERREMTVLFTDVRDFTTISESLDPQALSELMNAFLTPMTQVVHDHRGAIDKYMGDAMMAFWGAPLKDDEHALHCVDAAMDISRRMESLNVEFAERDWPQLRIGVGICTGNMSVGNMGSEFRMAYTVLGDAVNLGARLEGLTKQYGVEIIVSQSTVEAVPDYRFRELDRVRVKGKLEPVTIYEPMGVADKILPEQQSIIDQFETALSLFHQQKWDQARAIVENLNGTSTHKLYDMYLQRIAEFKLNPPGEDWDGVFIATSK
jgi:adenylate cyclase